MRDAIPVMVTALIAVGIILVGRFYLASPERISGTFGLKPPASDADTRAGYVLKECGISQMGLVVLTMTRTAARG